MNKNKVSIFRKTRLRLIQEEYSSLINKQVQWKDFSDYSYAHEFDKKRYKLIKGKLEANRRFIDQLIDKYSKERSFEQLNPIDIAILRVIIAELFFAKTASYKILIDEAVEISKRYSTANSYKYINAVLGSILRQEEFHGINVKV